MGHTMKDKTFNVISPIDGQIIHTEVYSDNQQLEQALSAQSNWSSLPLSKRIEIMHAFLVKFESQKPAIAEQICLQMGRPVHQAQFEVNGVLERAHYLLSIAEKALADDMVQDKHFMRRYPLGKVLIIAPWNYPYLTAINSIIPALLAGNEVILKHASQTPLCGQMLAHCMHQAGVPETAFMHLYLSHQQVNQLLLSPEIQFVSFTGSVAAGYQLQKQLGNRFLRSSFELGGKDPAIVLADCDLQKTVESLVDGAFFNSGQSCCGIERIYVAESCFDGFIEAFVSLTKQYQLGDPREASTNLGPMVSNKAASLVRQQIEQAQAQGAKGLIDESLFPISQSGTTYLAPQVLTDVDHSMQVMQNESFGPVVGIMPFKSIDQAIALSNDSQYGLTASIWTQDIETGLTIGDQIDTGTVFLNRCDYLNPALAWTGVKNTGIGLSLSHLGFHQLTRVKSFNINS